ncbi:MAG: transglycosylase family protein [Sciscionella sp.]
MTKVVLAGALVGAPMALAAAPANADSVNWDAIAQCESGGNWNTSTGNGYSGGLQFSQSTWQANGGSGSPQNASREQQIQVAENVKASQGLGAWPVCGSKGGSTASYDSGSSSSGSSSSGSDSSSSSSAEGSTSTQQSAPVQQAPKSNPKGDYLVKPGDTLTKIAKAKQVEGGWHAVYKLNNDYISNPDLIVPGLKIAIK